MSALPRMGAESVQPLFCRQIRSVSFFHRGESSQVDAFPVEADGGAPLVVGLVPMRTNRPVFGASVLLVESVRRLAQVGYSVVRRIAVNVVNVTVGPNTVYIEPRETVHLVLPIVNHDLDIPLFVGAAQNVTCLRPASVHAPSEQARVWGVCEKVAQTLYAKIGFSHAVVSFERWFGQMPDSVRSGFGLRYFNAADSQEVQRHNGFVSVLAPMLGLTEAQTDALFFTAAGL